MTQVVGLGRAGGSCTYEPFESLFGFHKLQAFRRVLEQELCVNSVVELNKP